MTHADAETVLTQYLPYIKSLAARYRGRGAEFDDLVQEGSVIAWSLLLSYTGPPEGIGLHLWKELRYRVRDRAETLRRQAHFGSDASIEAMEDSGSAFSAELPDLGTEKEQPYRAIDLIASLSDDDAQLVSELANGSTQQSCARKRGITQQALSKRLKRIRLQAA